MVCCYETECSHTFTFRWGTTTATQSYTTSGQVQSFYLCNVGPNGIEEFNSASSDDQCEGINLGTGELYSQFPGLTDSSKVSTLITQARSALTQASQQYKAGVSNVIINGQNIKVGAPATNTPAIQCQDFMSPSDCNLLFNVCDPVICPSSRCNFGGAYPVQDVIQTGIVGSLLLCLPNAREGIAVPVCLTGINEGINNWISVEEAYQSCLQDSLSKGESTGICNQINSVYTCEFWWQQAAPLAGLIVPQALSVASGQNVRGGGEYLSVQNAWSNAQQSVNYLNNYYSSNSYALQAFNLRSTQDIGTAFCQNPLSLVFPSATNLLSTTTDSPPQFTGSFQEIPFTTATVPPTSQYQVYYHIYAGQNAGIYYSVYLQMSTGSSYYQSTSSIRPIDSGYISAGNYTDQTKDFTATAGYNQLCINVNGQVDCGFGQVSTSFAVNYLAKSSCSNRSK